MRASAAIAACSASVASAIARSGVKPATSGSYKSKSGVAVVMSAGLGSPEKGSGAMMRAKAQVSAASFSSAAREKSALEVTALRSPTKARNPRCFWRACFSFSTVPKRTPTSSESPSATTTSAAVAPFRFAAANRSSAISSSGCALMPHSVQMRTCGASPGVRAADRQAIDAHCRQADTNGHRLTILAARADAFVEVQIVTHHTDALEHIGTVADQCGTLDWPRDLARFDEIRLARRKHELAIGDVDLTTAEVRGIQAAIDGANNVFGGRLAGEHERVCHARHRNMREALAPSIAGQRHAHEPGVEPILQVSTQDALLDQHRAPGGSSFVVDVERAPTVRDRAVVDHGAQGRCDRLAEELGERRRLLAIEVAFETVADGLVEQHAWPSGAEDDRHGAGRGIDGLQVAQRLIGRRPREAQIAIVLHQKVELNAAAAAIGALLSIGTVFGNAGHVEPHQRLYVTHHEAGRTDDEDELLLDTHRRHDVLDARVVTARGDVDAVEQIDLIRQRRFER